MPYVTRFLRGLAALGVVAAALAACTPGAPYVQTVDDQNRMLYAPEAGY